MIAGSESILNQNIRENFALKKTSLCEATFSSGVSRKDFSIFISGVSRVQTANDCFRLIEYSDTYFGSSETNKLVSLRTLFAHCGGSFVRDSKYSVMILSNLIKSIFPKFWQRACVNRTLRRILIERNHSHSLSANTLSVNINYGGHAA